MLTVLRDFQGRLEAACEWQLVNREGRPDPNGLAVFVAQLELNPTSDATTSIKEIIRQIFPLVSERAQVAYWQRRDKTGMKLHAFTRQQLLRVFKKEVMV